MRFIFVFFVLLGPATAFPQKPVGILIQKINATHDISEKVELHLELSRYYQYHHPDSAIYFTRQGMELSKKLNYRLGEARLIGELGALNEKHDNLELARKYALEALAIFKELKHTEGIASQYNGLGIIEGKKGNYQAATKYFISALRLNEKAKNTPGIVQSYIKLGVVNERSGNLDKALNYYQRARELNENEPGALYTLLNNIGIVKAKKGDLKTALKYFEQGAALSDTQTFAPMHLNLAMNAGNALQELGQKDAALKKFNQVLIKTRLYKLPEIEARTLLNLSGLDSSHDLAYLTQALSLAKKIGNKELEAEIFQALSERHNQQGNYKEALEALTTHYRLKDSIYDLDKSREITSLEASYELDKSKERVKTLELSNKTRTAERNVGIIVIALILLTSGGLWFYLKKVQKLNSKLRELNSVKDKLFSIIGHDLRSPMSSIIQMIELMESGLLNKEETNEMLQALRNHSQVSLDTLDSLLLWGKGQLQGLKVRKSAFDSKAILQKNLAFFQRQADQKMITIIDEVPDSLHLFADKDHFDFVLRNLLSNAVKFSFPSGNIRISVDTDQKRGFAIFCIMDEGKGIGKALLGQLFHPMMDSGSGTAGEKGTGLGLMLCKEFLLASGGDIWVHSAEGKGSEFFFSLPLVATKTGQPVREVWETEITA